MNFGDFLYEAALRTGTPEGIEEFRKELGRNPALATSMDDAGTTLLIELAQYAQLPVIEALCDAGSDPDAVAATGESPLVALIHGAAAGCAEAPVASAEILLRHGADPNRLAYDGCSALHRAIIHAQVELVALLVRWGGDPAVRLKDGPSRENAWELARSGRFRGTESQRAEILSHLAGGPAEAAGDPGG